MSPQKVTHFLKLLGGPAAPKRVARGAAGNIKLKVIKELPLRAQVEVFSARTCDGLDKARGAILELLFPSTVPG